MSTPRLPDIRRHRDGRLAICLNVRLMQWRLFDSTFDSDRPVEYYGDLSTAENWRPVLVTDLPDPDSHDSDSHDTLIPRWDIDRLHDVDYTVSAWATGIEIDGVFYDAQDGEIEELEVCALKLLAAIHRHRQYHAQEVAQ